MPSAPGSDRSRLRLALLALAFLAGFARLAFALHDIQVRDADLYRGAQDETTIRRVRLPAPRGRILDRNGVVLAGNRPRYGAAFYLDELRAPGTWSNTVDRVMEQVRRVGEILGREPEVDRAGVWTHLRRRRPIPLVAFQDLDARERALLAERPEPLAGVDIDVRQDRVYPFGDLACHVVGYVGKGVVAEPPPPPPGVGEADGPGEEGAEAFDFLLPDLVGREGVEKAFDAELRGRGGARALRIDAVGYKRESIPAGDPVPGRDIVLTLDASLQAAAERALDGTLAVLSASDGRPRGGAAIILDAVSGDVLALASAPRYDLSSFVPSLPGATWKALLEDPARPLLHRALAGVYAPGSVVKPLVALAALGAGVLGPAETMACAGVFVRDGIRIRCSHRDGHGGPIDVRQALAVSCNPFFIELGLRLGWDGAGDGPDGEGGLRDAFEAVGFGARPAIDLPAGTGLLPSRAWKRAAKGERWTAGDTANASIGQGFLSVTPMQVARLALALANGGEVVAPRLVRDRGDGRGPQEDRVVEDRLVWSARDLALVRDGMVAAASPGGTARRAAVPGVALAAKTGTAEFGPRSARRKHAWILGYAPAEAPAHAFAVLVEDADAGGQSAAAVLRELVLALHPEARAAAGENAAGEEPAGLPAVPEPPAGDPSP